MIEGLVARIIFFGWIQFRTDDFEGFVVMNQIQWYDRYCNTQYKKIGDISLDLVLHVSPPTNIYANLTKTLDIP